MYCVYSPHVNMLRSVCVNAGHFLILYAANVKRITSLWAFGTFLHTQTLSASLQKHRSNNAWLAGLCWRPVSSSVGLHPTEALSGSGSVCITPMTEMHTVSAPVRTWAYILFSTWKNKNKCRNPWTLGIPLPHIPVTIITTLVLAVTFPIDPVPSARL